MKRLAGDLFRHPHRDLYPTVLAVLSIGHVPPSVVVFDGNDRCLGKPAKQVGHPFCGVRTTSSIIPLRSVSANAYP